MNRTQGRGEQITLYHGNTKVILYNHLNNGNIPHDGVNLVSSLDLLQSTFNCDLDFIGKLTFFLKK